MRYKATPEIFRLQAGELVLVKACSLNRGHRLEWGAWERAYCPSIACLYFGLRTLLGNPLHFRLNPHAFHIFHKTVFRESANQIFAFVHRDFDDFVLTEIFYNKNNYHYKFARVIESCVIVITYEYTH